MADRSFLTWPFFEDRHRALKDELDAFGAGLGELAHADDDVDATCRALVRAPGRVRPPAPERRARRALALPGPRDAGLLRRPARLRLRDAGPRLRRGLAVRHGRAEGRAPAARRRRRGHHRLRAVGAGGRLRRRGARDHRATRRRLLRARRSQDLDLERRHRRRLHRLRAHRRGSGRARALGLPRRCRHAGPAHRRAHRRDRAPSARDARLRGLPRARPIA